MAQPQSIVASLWSFWKYGQRAERTGYLIGALLVVSGDPSRHSPHRWWFLQGPVSLRKPTTLGFVWPHVDHGCLGGLSFDSAIAPRTAVAGV